MKGDSLSTAATAKTTIAKGLDASVLARIIEEGYGSGAWHGPDLKSALADVPSELAFWRPSAGRHSIAEIALHHTYCTHSVRQQLSDTPVEPFVLQGDDWFALPEQSSMTWPEIVRVVEKEQQQLAAVVAEVGEGRVQSTERFDLVLGITCHAVYHAGQVQLLKRLGADVQPR